MSVALNQTSNDIKKVSVKALKVFQSVLLRKSKKLLYCILDCDFHLYHEKLIILDNNEKWKVLEIFSIIRLLTEKEVKDFYKKQNSKKLFKIKNTNNSYKISDLTLSEEIYHKRLNDEYYRNADS